MKIPSSQPLSLRSFHYAHARPQPPGGLLAAATRRVPAVGLALRGRAVRADVRRARVRWCGARGVAFDGAGGALRLADSELVGCAAGNGSEAAAGGGGLRVAGPGQSAVVTRCALRGNWADGLGGAALLEGDDGALELVGCAVIGNQVRPAP